MSYIGGPLPGQEKEEESENRDLIQSYKDRTIGKETIDRTISVVQKLQKDTPEWLKQGASTTGSLLRDTYMDVRTLEGKEWLNPADVVTAGAVRAVEGIGWLGQKAIAEPVEAIAHKGLGIDPRGAKFLGIATEIAVTAGGAPKAAKYVKSGAAVGDLTEFAFKTADPESIAGMVYRTGGGVAPVPKTLIGKTEGYLKKAGRTKEAITHNLQLKTQMGEWFEQNADALLKGNLDRGAFGKIVDSDGVRQDVLGLNKYLNSVKAGKPDPSVITFSSSKTRHLKNTKRLERMRAPTGGLERLARKLFPEDPALAKKLVEEYRIDAGRGFKRVQDAAKKNTALGDPSDAGHWFSTKSSTGPNPLDRAPTSGQSARIENRIKNRKGGTKVEHDINPYAAQKAGIPRNWEEDFLYYLDRKYQKGNVIDWKAEYGNEAFEMIESIPYNASKAEVDKVFNEINAMMKPRHEQIGKHLEDLKLEQRYTELPEYTPD